MARATIAERVATLGDLSRSELTDLWVKQYGVAPPLGMRQPQLLRAVAYHLQEKQIGGLSPLGKRLLKAAVKRVSRQSKTAGEDAPAFAAGVSNGATQGEDTSPTAKARRSASPYAVALPRSRLIREWNGRRYVVEVVKQGFIMDGKTYRSLSAIALRITGTQWSGPRFFGL
ncbi:MAG: putative bacteriophage-related protein [Rhizobium sp.]|nr:putative bacteriophage-related protein [Rhizobium sp.]